ncbi:oxygen-independent coproporphyrinogen-III oxidase 1 [bacterium BMS3Bbin05]|nr:oxygen-independent coproporphyrinogen-III oxidase 1 [bacterium BMS3Bbin05]
MKSLYIHVPFCLRKCRYCDFYSVESNSVLVDMYLNALEKEFSLYSEHLRDLRTVYIGGGTPSVLSGDKLEKLLKIIAGNIQLAQLPPVSVLHEKGYLPASPLGKGHPPVSPLGKGHPPVSPLGKGHPPVSPLGKGGIKGGYNGNGYEYTIEINPATITPEKIEILGKWGVNRISIGIQSLNDSFLSLLGRAHTAGQAEKTIDIIRENFNSFSVDLICAIPGQNRNDWEKTLNRVLSFSPPHISAYELTPERGTPLWYELESGGLRMPDEESILEMYEITSRKLTGEGYRHYEISNYSMPGYESLHNINYWRRGEYIGLGPSAHSLIGGKRFGNVSDILKYCEMLQDNETPVESVFSPSPEDVIRETILLGLRTAEGIGLAGMPGIVRENTGGRIDEDAFIVKLDKHLQGGLVKIDNKRLHLTEKGFLLSNSVIVEVMRAMRL